MTLPVGGNAPVTFGTRSIRRPLSVWLLLAGLVASMGCARGHRGAGAGAGAVLPRDEFPGLSAIREDELRSDLFALAGDQFRGREAGTLDELRASAWLAERARAAGLEPAGDQETYFQFWSLRRTRFGPSSRLSIDGSPLSLGDDAVVVTPPGPVRYEGPLVFLGEGGPKDAEGKDLTGKIVVAEVSPPTRPIPPEMSLRTVRYAFAAIDSRGVALAMRRPAAVILIADAIADSGFAWMAMSALRGRYEIDSTGAPGPPHTGVPILMVRAAHRDRVARASRADISLTVESLPYPSVNVVAKIRGTDPALRDQYVLYSGHQDHDGVRAPVAGDSIYNGADDNASVSVALLAIGRAFAARPGRRSALFVWHGAEERGLLGSRWHAGHPMVPRTQIVAVLNADMIGGNHPDSAALLGVQPPHRNSIELARMGLAANEKVGRFALDSSWDRPTHPEGWYFRSDHLPYARLGIPALYFTTLPHARYHTPDDEPEYIDVAKLARMTRWMYATGWLVAMAAARPALDPGVKLER